VVGGPLEYRIGGRLHQVRGGAFLLMAAEASYQVNSLGHTTTTADGIYLPVSLGPDLLRAACPYSHVIDPDPWLVSAYERHLRVALEQGPREPKAKQQSLMDLIEALIEYHQTRVEELDRILHLCRMDTVQRIRRRLDWARDFVDANLDRTVTLPVAGQVKIRRIG
jgi:hypothetical protein